ncbi:MAG: 4-(cytidine 5'-diphospho)-2-C-methyl-D-erythritol kinase [Gemmatimonadota bacterium]|nr:MAG: 4-(cytidine 5'-diphospho)-2-C-methyl-D-erythritol kinase [Gemmatimonadota bacterium]
MAKGWLQTEARAKVNLALRIFPRRPDGFHPIETLFCRIDFADRVRTRLRGAPGVSIRVSGTETAPEGPDNLAARAAALFLERTGMEGGVEIQLEKFVPPGSGLGGGSSDAAAVLRALAGAAESPPSQDELLALASQLGADVTFFVADTPLAFAWGRGERVLACPGLAPRPMLLVLPDVAISTAEAYARWDERRGGAAVDAVAPLVRPASDFSSWESIHAAAVNDFEPVIFGLRPDLRLLRDALSETGASFALLSGSGSALFAVYEGEEQRDVAAAELRGVLEGVRVVSACGPV